MRILGIDPGIARLGWGVIEKEKNDLRAVAFDCFETHTTESLPTRLTAIHTVVTELLQTYNPDVLVVEELFFGSNAKTAFAVGQARGVVLLAGGEKQIPVTVYTPLQVKTALVGYGRAEKSQVGHMVKVILKLKEVPKPDDTTDALAVALTYAFSQRSARVQK